MKFHIVAVKSGKRLYKEFACVDVTRGFNTLLDSQIDKEIIGREMTSQFIAGGYSPVIVIEGARSRKQAVDTAVDHWVEKGIIKRTNLSIAK